MKTGIQQHIRCLLIFITVLVCVPASAELEFNLPQAEKIGLDNQVFNAKLNALSDNEVKLTTSSSDYFNKGHDILALNSSEAITACRENQLIRLGQQATFKPLFKNKFHLQDKSDECSINFVSYSLTIAYPTIGLVSERPRSPADLFDLESFPGQRALPDTPVGILEWALMAYGIPYNEVYQLLSTDRGLRLAFAKLDEIKRNIIWWQDTDELKKLIIDHRVNLAAGPNTVFFELQLSQPMEIVWPGQISVMIKLAIDAQSSNVNQAEALLLELMNDSNQFKLAYELGLGPSNRKTLRSLELLPQAGQISAYIPSYRKNMENAIWMNHRWHQALDEKIETRFRQWRSQNNH